MRILFLTRSLDAGGAERQLVSLATGLHARGHAVSVATFYGGGAFAPELAAAGVRHVSLEKRGRWDMPGFLGRFFRCVRAERPDIVHGYLPTVNIVTLLARRRVGRGPRIVWGVRASDMRLDRYDWMERWSYVVEAQLSRFADRIIVNSERGLDAAIARGMRADRMVVIPNGIDVRKFRPDAALRQVGRAALGIGDGTALVGLPARFDAMKDHATFLAAARQLSADCPDVAFLLVGEGTAAGNPVLDRLAQDAGLAAPVLRLGRRDDMPAVYASLDIVCLSSAFGEGFPNAVGEAMAAGVPCVATDVGDTAAVIGDSGEIVPPGDSHALADALARMIARLRAEPEAVRAAARARIVERYDRVRLIDRTEQVLTALIDGRTVEAAAA